MLKIIGILLLGIAAGYLLRRYRWTGRISSCTTVTIAVLLFIMGCEIGGTEGVMSNILSIGGQGILIGLAATAGSVAAAYLLYRTVFMKEKGAGNEK